MKDKKQQSLKVLASTAAAMPMLTVNSEAEIIVNSSLAGTVISWNNTPSATANLFGSVGFNIGTRATASGGVSASFFVGVGAAWNGTSGGFRRGGNGLNAAFLGAAGDTFNAVGIGQSQFANINLGSGYGGNIYSNLGNYAFSSAEGPKYLMFRFDNGGTFNYGWLEITEMTGTGSGSQSDYSATLGNFAYDNSGATLANGVVPEPSSVALLMMGAMVGGARLLRRAREQSAS